MQNKYKTYWIKDKMKYKSKDWSAKNATCFFTFILFLMTANALNLHFKRDDNPNLNEGLLEITKQNYSNHKSTPSISVFQGTVFTDYKTSNSFICI